MKDAIVREMREIRRQIEAEFDHDPNKCLDHVYEAQRALGNKLVCRQPKLLERREITRHVTRQSAEDSSCQQ